MGKTFRILAGSLALLSLTLPPAALRAQELGKGGSKATGSAGPDGAQNASAELERCDAPKGTIAVVEPQTHVAHALQRYQLGSPTSVIRMLIQQSNCFQVVERGVAMQNMMQERALAQSGQLQADQNIGKGQMVTADFIVTPNVVFTDNNAGGVGGGLMGVLGGSAGRLLGGVAGGLKFKQAQTSLMLSDSRSGIQVAAAEGSAEKADFNLGGALFGGGAAGGMGGYSSTNEGKLVAASFIDNWNNIVRAIRNSPSLVQARAGAAAQQNAATSVQANAAAAGDVMVPKIAGAKVLKQPRDGAGELQTLGRADEVLFLGEERDGFLKVQAAAGEGWVKKLLLRKQ
ncbi:CsgG/HfaB family protein [Roseateles violae]|uniref:CsgG/HfaB family protein n=1 Tax=Roseateles violae TaxID=3058042 RepID=A0ABT8DUX0_9BURK|nr:CsgG/HfaB family protein [Pelomonas sp. PFR6]MDN3920114.1 CsgG/HfaB family protein [Pelomonas sp. PFR6]